MKRIFRITIILYVSATLALLSGCQRNIMSSRQNMERLRPIQTIGLDRQGDGVVMSISSGIGPDDDPPLVMKCAASGFESAITRLQDYSPEDELFYAHVQYILLGETIAGDSIMPLLDWVERSPTMRTGTELFVVKGNADVAVTATTGEDTDITERLADLEREESRLGQHVFTLREVAASMTERGCALCLALQAYPSTNTILTDSKASAAIVPVGYAVLQEGVLTAYLSQDETLGAQLIAGEAVGSQFIVDENMLELLECGTDVSGQWEGGRLTGISVRCELKAGIREQEKGGEEDLQALQGDFQASVLHCLEGVIARSQELGCDFLDLEGFVLESAPGHRLPDSEKWTNIFPSLPVTVEVKGEISRSYDLSD